MASGNPAFHATLAFRLKSNRVGNKIHFPKKMIWKSKLFLEKDFFKSTYWQMQFTTFSRNVWHVNCNWLSHNFLAESSCSFMHSGSWCQVQDGGGGLSARRTWWLMSMEIWFQKMAHCNRNMVVDINDKMVSEVMTPCRRDMVPDLSYNMVVVTAFCRRDMAPDLSFNMVVVVAPCRRDMVPELC